VPIAQEISFVSETSHYGKQSIGRDTTFLNPTEGSSIAKAEMLIDAMAEKNSMMLESEVTALQQRGIPVYLHDNNLGEGELLKVYPDDRKVIVAFDDAFNEMVVREV